MQVLFPGVGRQAAGEWALPLASTPAAGGAHMRLPMPLHGFIKDAIFTDVQQHACEACGAVLVCA
ncbi:hypothetical protein EON67_07515, partial [archaeon]